MARVDLIIGDNKEYSLIITNNSVASDACEHEEHA